MIATITSLVTLFIDSLLVINNRLGLGSLIAFNSYTALLFTPINKLLTLPPIYSQMRTSVERIEQSDFSCVNYIQGTYIKTAEIDSALVIVENFIPYVEDRALFSKGLNFAIRKGEIVQISGRNGSGKSILLKSLINYRENFLGIIK